MPLTKPEQLRRVLAERWVRSALGHRAIAKPSGLAVYSRLEHIKLPYRRIKERKAAQYLSQSKVDELVRSSDGSIRRDIDLFVTTRPGGPMPDRAELEQFAALQAQNAQLVGGNVSVLNKRRVLTLYTKRPEAALDIQAVGTVENPHSFPQLARALGAAGLAVAQVELYSNGAAIGQNGQRPYAELAQLFVN